MESAPEEAIAKRDPPQDAKCDTDASDPLDEATTRLTSEIERCHDRFREERLALRAARTELDLERHAFERERDVISNLVGANDIVRINAGGLVLTCRRQTLLHFPDSHLGAMFSGRWEQQLNRDDDGNVYLELNGPCFQHLLEYLRDLSLPSEEPVPAFSSPAGNEDRMARMLRFLQLDVLTAQLLMPAPASFACSLVLEKFVVPCTCTYDFELAGAAGGTGGRHGGQGAVVKATLRLVANETLLLLVGHQGSQNPNGLDAGGGGGTFIAQLDGGSCSPLLVAGGGGGSRGFSIDPPGNDALLTSCGGPGSGASADSSGGSNGAGGTKASNGFGGGGAGFYGNGERDASGEDAQSFTNGGAGSRNGGFGGGGCTGDAGGGGAGGYSGGGGGNAGGGGGTFVSERALRKELSIGNAGHGYIRIQVSRD